MAETRTACDSPIKRTVHQLRVFAKTLGDVRSLRQFASPEEGRHEADRQSLVGGHTANIGKGMWRIFSGRMRPFFKVASQLLPELGSLLRSRERGEQISPVPLIVDRCVARAVRKAAYHILHVFSIVRAAHVCRKHQLEV